MARRTDLRQLVPDENDRDTIVMPDGKEFFMPRLGVTEMAQMLMTEESMTRSDTLKNLAKANGELIGLLRKANPKRKVPDYDLTVDEVMACIAAFSGAGSVAERIREALSGRDEESGDVASQEEAIEAARRLAQEAGMRDEGEEGPLASAKPSRKRSSRSATSGTGGRNGGKKPAGKSSRRTSRKPVANSSA